MQICAGELCGNDLASSKPSLRLPRVWKLLQAHRIFTEFIEKGDVDPKGKRGPKPYLKKLDNYMEMFIIGLILETPSLYLKELCKKVEEVSGESVSEATICRLLHSHGFTRKKIRQVALQRSTYLRGAFMSEVLLYRKEMFVWLDETGCDNRSYMRKYGYAIKGDVPIYQRFLVRGTRVSAIAAISTEGLVALDLTTQTVNSEFFYDFVRGSLIPQMTTFDGSSSTSIVIMDNCSIHHVQEVEDMFKAAGIAVIFLPPYSPDYNPIEETFSYVKSYLREHDYLLQSITDPCSVLEYAFNSITPSHCSQWITHSGYF